MCKARVHTEGHTASQDAKCTLLQGLAVTGSACPCESSPWNTHFVAGSSQRAPMPTAPRPLVGVQTRRLITQPASHAPFLCVPGNSELRARGALPLRGGGTDRRPAAGYALGVHSFACPRPSPRLSVPGHQATEPALLHRCGLQAHCTALVRKPGQPARRYPLCPGSCC